MTSRNERVPPPSNKRLFHVPMLIPRESFPSAPFFLSFLPSFLPSFFPSFFLSFLRSTSFRGRRTQPNTKRSSFRSNITPLYLCLSRVSSRSSRTRVKVVRRARDYWSSITIVIDRVRDLLSPRFVRLLPSFVGWFDSFVFVSWGDLWWNRSQSNADARNW